MWSATVGMRGDPTPVPARAASNCAPCAPSRVGHGEASLNPMRRCRRRGPAGAHQFRSPRSFMSEGTRRARTIVASRRTAATALT
jgi:hypothetical protein